MKKKIIKLKESDLHRIVKRVIKENMINELGGMDDGHPRFGNLNFSELSRDEILRMGTSEYSEDSDEDLDDDSNDNDDWWETLPLYENSDKNSKRRYNRISKNIVKPNQRRR